MLQWWIYHKNYKLDGLPDAANTELILAIDRVYSKQDS